jgi:hypothetical protein
MGERGMEAVIESCHSITPLLHHPVIISKQPSRDYWGGCFWVMLNKGKGRSEGGRA